MKSRPIVAPAPPGDCPIWYVDLEDETSGPFAVAQIRQLLEEGWIKPATFVQAGDGATTTAGELVDRD